MKIFIIITNLVLIYAKITKSSYNNDLSTCLNEKYCFGTDLCNKHKITQSKIKPESLSKETCFSQNHISFKMGTDKPYFETDGEGPVRTGIFISAPA
jgi:hypothetical protein